MHHRLVLIDGRQSDHRKAALPDPASSAVLKLNNTARRGSLVLDEHLGTFCTARGGLIAIADSHLSDTTGMNSFCVPLTAPARFPRKDHALVDWHDRSA